MDLIDRIDRIDEQQQQSHVRDARGTILERDAQATRQK